MTFELDAHYDKIFGVGVRPLCIARSAACPGEENCDCRLVRTGKAKDRPRGMPSVRADVAQDEVAERYAREHGVFHQVFPSLARLRKDMVITEKIDGSNAAIGVTEEGVVYAQSRKKLLEPGAADMSGFAAFVIQHADQLREQLGTGLHFGEWWGSRIQRTYDQPDGVRHFSLFNTGRWDSPFNQASADADYSAERPLRDVEVLTTRCIQCPLLKVVPVLYTGTFDTGVVQNVMYHLLEHGSYAAPFYGDPEGLVIYHSAANRQFKLTPDDRHKGER